MQFVAVFH